MAIYRKNEPGRFPEGHAPVFEKFLQSDAKTCIVAELESEIVACASMTCEAPDLAMLLYGLVDPQHQGSRVGSTLTLLRLAQLPLGSTNIFVLICAVNASMPFYHRFGFREYGRWKTSENGEDHPGAVLCLSHWELQRLKKAMERRNIRVTGKLTLHPSQTTRGEVIYGPEGPHVMWHPREADAQGSAIGSPQP